MINKNSSLRRKRIKELNKADLNFLIAEWFRSNEPNSFNPGETSLKSKPRMTKAHAACNYWACMVFQPLDKAAWADRVLEVGVYAQ